MNDNEANFESIAFFYRSIQHKRSLHCDSNGQTRQTSVVFTMKISKVVDLVELCNLFVWINCAISIIVFDLWFSSCEMNSSTQMALSDTLYFTTMTSSSVWTTCGELGNSLKVSALSHRDW